MRRTRGIHWKLLHLSVWFTVGREYRLKPAKSRSRGRKGSERRAAVVLSPRSWDRITFLVSTCNNTRGALPARPLSLCAQSFHCGSITRVRLITNWLTSVSSPSRGRRILREPKHPPQIALLVLLTKSAPSLNHVCDFRLPGKQRHFC